MKININGYEVEGSVEEIKQLLDLKEEKSYDDNVGINIEKERLVGHVLRQIENAYNNINPEAEVSREVIDTVYSDDASYDEVKVVIELNYVEKINNF